MEKRMRMCILKEIIITHPPVPHRRVYTNIHIHNTALNSGLMHQEPQNVILFGIQSLQI